jgi:hypothetical protein
VVAVPVGLAHDERQASEPVEVVVGPARDGQDLTVQSTRQRAGQRGCAPLPIRLPLQEPVDRGLTRITELGRPVRGRRLRQRGDQDRQAAGEFQDHVHGRVVVDPARREQLTRLGGGEHLEPDICADAQVIGPEVGVQRALSGDREDDVRRQVAMPAGQQFQQPVVEKPPGPLERVDEQRDRPAFPDRLQIGDERGGEHVHRRQQQLDVLMLGESAGQERPGLIGLQRGLVLVDLAGERTDQRDLLGRAQPDPHRGPVQQR